MTIGRTSSPESAHFQRRLFTLALLLSTWIPMAFFIAVGSSGTSGGGLHTARAALLFVGGIHVAATLLLYVDKRFLRLVREHQARYVYLPMALIMASGLIFTLGGPALQVFTYVIFWAWQTHHYGRQNIGVYSFASIARGWRPHPLERRALQLTVACGICGTFKIPFQSLEGDLAPGYLHSIFNVLYRIGFLGFLGVLIFSVYVFFKNKTEVSLGKAAVFFTLVLFFFPMFLSTNIDVAFFSYAIAHGSQYLVFMTALSFALGAREGRRGVSGSMMALGAIMVLIGLVGYRAADLKSLESISSMPIITTLIDFLAGIGLGLTVSHFVIDAGAWRLSQPSARQYVTRRFGFLFEGAPDRSLGPAPQASSR